MPRSKADVDKHVESLLAKVSLKEFKSRAYSIARLYYDAGDYASTKRYVEQYLSIKENDAPAHKLLGLALQQLGEKEKALEQFKISLDIDPTQTNLLLDICILLSDDEVFIDPGRARYWCERAQVEFPRHPATFNLRERLLAHTNPDPDALIHLLKAELQQRPRDATLHARLLKQYLVNKNYKEAFDHSFDVEFGENNAFKSNYAWYEVLSEVLALDEEGKKSGDWRRCLLELTVAEKLCSLSLSDGPGEIRSLIETAAVLHRYDQDLQRISTSNIGADNTEFQSALLQHHRGQFSFYAACFLLKKAKKEQLSWKEAVRPSSPLFLLALHTAPLDPNVSWLVSAPPQQRMAARRWHIEGSYRCSQSGHCLLSSVQEKNQTFVDKVSNFCGNRWKDKLYERLFTSKEQLNKSKSSHFLSDKFENPILRLPRRKEVQAYDLDAQKMYPSSLHHIVWILMNYKNYSHFKLVIFEMLKPASQNYPNCGPETLNRLDVEAFAFAAALTAVQCNKTAKHPTYLPAEFPDILPANITDLLCTPTQMKWWDCAFKVSCNEVGTELSDIRSTLRRGIEVVRCIDNHGMDPYLLCKLANIFAERAKNTNSVDDKENLEMRASLYYSSAIPLLEKLKSKIMIWLTEKRMFNYNHPDLSTKEITTLLEEAKLYVGEIHMNEGESEKAVEILTGLKSARSSFLIGKIYMKMASDKIDNPNEHVTSEDRSKHVILLSKAKDWAYTTVERLKCHPDDRLETETLNLIEQIEKGMSRIDPDVSNSHDYDSKYSSDENESSDNSQLEKLRRSGFIKGVSLFRNVSSTPKQRSLSNSTHYKSSIDTHLLEASRLEKKHLEKIESQIKGLQKKDSSMTSFMEQIKSSIAENRNLGEEVRELKNNLVDKIVNKINSNIQDTVDQFKILKISVDQVKDKIGEYRDECKNEVGDLKKEVSELKREITKLKSSTVDQTLDDSDLYNLEDFQTNESTPAFNSQLPFTPQMLQAFNRGVVPPVVLPPTAYSMYGQSLYNLYNQFSQLSQPPPVPPAPLFDPTRPANYSGVYTPTDYSEVPSFPPPPVVPSVIPPPVVPPVIPPPIVPPVIPPPVIPAVIPPPVVPAIISSKVSTPIIPPVSHTSAVVQNKEIPHSLPVNVVITSSDPMPPRTSIPQPVMSVTIPPQHLKNSPHNYQIPMPTTAANLTTNIFGGVSNTNTQAAAKPFVWGQTPTFGATTNTTPAVSSTFDNTKLSLFDVSKSSAKDNSSLNTSFTPNTSLNKSRTLSEKSNTSVDYDPCPDFKPIIALPDEVKVTTGEEDETAIFSARAKLYRFVDKEWKERGLGEMKLLKHRITGKVRVLMRREQIHKICANHVITPDLEISPMKNESRAYIWVANDFADETVVLEKFCVRFKTSDIAKEFYETFEKSRKTSKTPQEKKVSTVEVTKTEASKTVVSTPSTNKTVLGGFTFSSTPNFKELKDDENNKKDCRKTEEISSKPNVFSGFNFKSQTGSSFSNILSTSVIESPKATTTPAINSSSQLNTSDVVEEFEPSVDFKPVVALPALVDQVTGEEDENVLFEHRAKLLRFDVSTKEWKERGLGNIKILIRKDNNQKVRLLMRREIVMKVCCNHGITKNIKFEKMPNQDKAVTWCAKDFSEGELTSETFCIRFKTVYICDEFLKAIQDVQNKLGESLPTKKEENKESKLPTVGFGDQFKPKPGAWSCQACYTNNLSTAAKCLACETPKVVPAAKETADENIPLPVANWGDKFKPKAGSWECSQCLIRNETEIEYCKACESPKDPSKPKKESSSNSILNVPGAPKFTFGIPAATNTTKPATMPTFGIPASEPTKSAPSSVITFGTNTQSKPMGTFTFGNPVAASPPPTVPKKTEDSSRTVPFGQAKALSQTPPKDLTKSFAKESGTFDFKMELKGKSVKSPGKDNESDSEKYEEDEGHHIHFTPVIPLPDEVDVKTGEENEEELYSHRAKLFRFVSGEWKERGIGNVKILKHKDNGKLRVLMRRDQILKICLNHALTPDIKYTNKDDKTWLFTANDFSEGEINFQQFCLRFKNKEIADMFKKAVDEARSGIKIAPKDTSSVKSDSSDDVVFVSETQASSDDKTTAKQLMLPENFFTYKNKPTCKGCRGCEHNEDKTMKSTTVQAPSVTVSTPDKSVFSASPSSSIFTTPMALNISSDNTIFATPMGASDDNTSNTSHTVDETNTSIDKENSTPNIKITLKQPLLATPKLSAAQSSDAKSVFGQQNTEQKSIFSFSSEQKPLFGASVNQNTNAKSIFGSNNQQTSIFGSTNKSEQKTSIFGTSSQNVDGNNTFGSGSIFGSSKEQAPEVKSIFGSAAQSSNTQPLFGKLNFGIESSQKPEVKSIFGSNSSKPEVKSIFGSSVQSDAKSIFNSANNKKQESIFGSLNDKKQEPSTIFGSFNNKNQQSGSAESKSATTAFGTSNSIFSTRNPEDGQPEVKSIFSTANNTQQSSAKSIFGNTNQNSIFGGFSSDKSIFGSTEQKSEAKSIFGSANQNKPIFGSDVDQKSASVFDSANGSSIFGTKSSSLSSGLIKADSKPSKDEGLPFKTDDNLSFAALSTENGAAGIPIKQSENFQWEGAGQQLFSSGKQSGKDKSKHDNSTEETDGAAADEEYDPHYEPIVPLPDKIVVTTGEEDEEKLFCERAKLYRFDKSTHEWKERGVGEMKVLYHPQRKTYRLLLRREQVHKAVLNMLLFKDLELLRHSEKAWTWVAVNYAESASGETETLSVRFKNADLAQAFFDKVQEVIRKLQVADAQAYRERQEAAAAAKIVAQPALEQPVAQPATQHATQPVAADDEADQEHTLDDDYDEDCEEYYQEEEEHAEVVAEAPGSAAVLTGDAPAAEGFDEAVVQLLYDQEVYAHKLLLIDAATGQILADTVVAPEMPFQLDGATATWSGSDYATEQEVEKTVTFTFATDEDAEQFYEAVQNVKNYES